MAQCSTLFDSYHERLYLIIVFFLTLTLSKRVNIFKNYLFPTSNLKEKLKIKQQQSED